MAKSGGIFHSVPKGVQPPAQSSAPQNTSVGSGSRPTKSKIKIDSSAPMDAYGLDGRKTKGSLGG